jgi:DNA topoisomerase VI subunit B
VKKARPADGLPLFPEESSTAVVAKRPSRKKPAANARPEGGKASAPKGKKDRSAKARPPDSEEPPKFEKSKGAKGGDGAAAPEAPPAATPPRTRVTAEELGERQREISVAEFFTKNRHLLGFDHPRKALLTAVKEAVDNSLDACEEAGFPPDLAVEIAPVAGTEDRFRIAVQDNGPGIVRKQIPRIFGKLLYGSKFHTLKQQRGQQGIGISAAGMYGQLTTGKPVVIVSKIGKGKKAHRFEITIDTKKNEPIALKDEEIDWTPDHGTRVEIELQGEYLKGARSVDEYLRQTAVANPHTRLVYLDPGGETRIYERGSESLPREVRAIRPHPHGVELGALQKMLQETNSHWLVGFLQADFCRVGQKTAQEICAAAGLQHNARPKRIAREEADKLHRAIAATKIMAPPTDCIAPIGEAGILAGLKKEVEADFYSAASRSPSVYRGNPFAIEVGLAYGKPGGFGVEVDEASGKIRQTAKKKADESLLAEADEPVRLLRFANRVPLLYQQSACAVTKSVIATNWKAYGLQQPRGALPVGPAVLFIHMASVWVPFTSESKEAIASYPEIAREIRLALQEVGRRLATYLRKGRKLVDEFRKRSYIEKYIPHIGIGLQEILGLDDKEREKTVAILTETLEKSRQLD